MCDAASSVANRANKPSGADASRACRRGGGNENNIRVPAKAAVARKAGLATVLLAARADKML